MITLHITSLLHFIPFMFQLSVKSLHLNYCITHFKMAYVFPSLCVSDERRLNDYITRYESLNYDSQIVP